MFKTNVNVAFDLAPLPQHVVEFENKEFPHIRGYHWLSAEINGNYFSGVLEVHTWCYLHEPAMRNTLELTRVTQRLFEEKVAAIRGEKHSPLSTLVFREQVNYTLHDLADTSCHDSGVGLIYMTAHIKGVNLQK